MASLLHKTGVEGTKAGSNGPGSFLDKSPGAVSSQCRSTKGWGCLFGACWALFVWLVLSLASDPSSDIKECAITSIA